MEEKQSRVRWDDQALSRLAAAMAARLLAKPDPYLLRHLNNCHNCGRVIFLARSLAATFAKT